MEPPTNHMDRLTAIDASFLSNENENSHMHIGAMLTFEGPPPAHADSGDHVLQELHTDTLYPWGYPCIPPGVSV